MHVLYNASMVYMYCIPYNPASCELLCYTAALRAHQWSPKYALFCILKSTHIYNLGSTASKKS